jgi:hypothetical protein
LRRRDLASVILPGGLWVDGVCHKDADIHPLTGEDEAFILEGESPSLAAKTTAILFRCLTRLGSLDTITMEMVGSLSVGDREALLLNLRRLTLGDRMQCVLLCPEPNCGEAMDLDLRASELLLPPYNHSQEWYEVAISGDGDLYYVTFRLPNGDDQEAAAYLSQSDPEAAANMLLNRCIKQVAAKGSEEDALMREGDTLMDWQPNQRGQISTKMAELDPQAEIRLNLSCPYCGRSFTAIFDTATFFFQEISRRINRLYEEVHWLAFYYHWSEAEIMGMTSKKRLMYLNLLSDALSEGGK